MRAEEEQTAIYICPRGRLYEFPGVSQERCDAMVARVRRENYLRMKMNADVEDSTRQEVSEVLPVHSALLPPQSQGSLLSPSPPPHLPPRMTRNHQ